jgi:hypothetical protein
MPRIIPFSRPLRPALPQVRGNVDYRNFEKLLVRVDEIIRESGIERLFVDLSMEALMAQCAKAGRSPCTRELIRHQIHSVRALRTMVLQPLLNESFRGLSRRLAECPLFRWFCDMDELIAEVPGKSTLQRYSLWIDQEAMRSIINSLTLAAAGGKDGAELHPLELANAVELDLIWLDSTCIKANIHFPVDWVLLRDATRTLVKAITLIRKHGLKHRIAEPESFLTQMNRLCIEMTHTRGPKEESKRERKRLLRKMKRLVNIVEEHAQRYRDLLEAHWQETDWSHAQACQVIQRIDSIITKLPQAKKQAHERLINERQVDNKKKRLSLYEDDIHVIVRGKAGGILEFGNSLLLAEQPDGLIVDFELMREQAPSDSRWLPKSLGRIEVLTGRFPMAVGGDRGCDSEANRDLLDQKGAFNGICPRSVTNLKKRSKEELFMGMQRRRAQTEARVAIFKNKMLGGKLRAKGYKHRVAAVGWAVLSHNLWVLARLKKRAAPELAKAA